MDIGRILSRSFEITRRFPVLWIFGFLLAISGGAGGGNSPLSYSFDRRNLQIPGQTLPDFRQPETGTLIAIAGAVACLGLIWLVLLLYFRFMARGALISGVRDAEAGAPVALRTAWRGGQPHYLRLLGLGFLVNGPLVLGFFLLFAIALLPLIPLITTAVSSGGRSTPDVVAPIVGSSLLLFGCICCLAVGFGLFTLVIHPIYELAARAIVLDTAGVVDGLRRGWRRFRDDLGNMLILYVALIAARIGWGIVGVLVALPLFFVVGALFVLALTMSQLVAVLVALLVGIPVLLILAFFESLFQTFEGVAWTLAYASPAATAVLPAPAAPPPPAAMEQPALPIAPVAEPPSAGESPILPPAS